MSVVPPVPAPPAPAPWVLFVPGLLTLLGGAATFLTLGSFVQILNVPTGLWWTEIAVFAAMPLLALRAFGLNPWRTTGLDGFSLGQLAFGFLVGMVNYVAVAMPVQWTAVHVFPKVLVQMFDTAQLFRTLSGPDLVMTSLAVCIAAPICEEITFRGLIHRALAEKAGPWVAIVVGGAIFSGFHFDPVGFAVRFELGALFGWMAWKSGSIWAGVGAHAANNSTSMLLYLLSPDAKDDDATWKQVALMFAVGMVVLVAVLKLLPRRFPSLLKSPRPAETSSAGPKGMIRPILYWFAGTVFTISALFAFDYKGTQLGLMDAKWPVRFDESSDPELTTLMDLRSKARRGEVELEVYQERRKADAKTHPLFDFMKVTPPADDAPNAGLPEKPSESSKPR